MPKFSTPKGTGDILPEAWPYWQFVVNHAQSLAELFGYRRIETPIFGDTSLFARSSGEGTDVVDKEMYTFQDRDGASLSLRPEGTAPVMRAYLQHGLHKEPQPVKLYYIERMYRYDKPQRGRFREHRQFGCEAIGSDDPYVDVEMIALLGEFYARCGLQGLSLQINSIGDANCRPAFLRDLVVYLTARQDRLAPLDLHRLERNPLRVLDSKERETQPVLSGAPAMVDYLCDVCESHWNQLRRGLDTLGISYQVNPRLVRGLDYYTRTVFEFLSPREGAQAALGGGGRYDGLAEAIGGPQVPGIGFGSGLERLILTMQDQGVEVPPIEPPLAYVAHTGEGTGEPALRLAHDLRRAGFRAELAFGSRSLNGQMKRANGAGARFVAIIGEDELAAGVAQLRDLHSGDQTPVPFDRVVNFLAESAAP